MVLTRDQRWFWALGTYLSTALEWAESFFIYRFASHFLNYGTLVLVLEYLVVLFFNFKVRLTKCSQFLINLLPLLLLFSLISMFGVVIQPLLQVLLLQ